MAAISRILSNSSETKRNRNVELPTMRILVTGGAGYIGSHTLTALLSDGHDVCVIDNFVNSSPRCLDRVADLTEHSFRSENCDVKDGNNLTDVFASFKPEAVIHFAGLKAVSESQRHPLSYYDQNVGGTIGVLNAMDGCGCSKIVFSSSATVYGVPQYLPYDEDHNCTPINPYGRTKYFIEEILRDWSLAHSHRSAMLLRYFNPVGAHKSGHIGEDPQGIPNNLVPYIAQVATGQREKLHIFGNDYDTPDGTGVRDYIHVSDLADGHLAALDYIKQNSGVDAVNLGTGLGYSVMEMVDAFEKASGRSVNYEIMPRRAGDLDIYFADASKAENLFGWKSKRGINEMCQDVWRWQSQNPKGFVD